MIRRLSQDRRGATAVEFALVAPALLAAIFLLLEGGRMIWTQQVLQETAFAAARCMALKSDGCTAPGDMPGWAVAHAAASGVRIPAESVTPEADAGKANALCDNRTGMNSIAIVSPYAVAAGNILPATVHALTASACFPAA